MRRTLTYLQARLLLLLLGLALAVGQTVVAWERGAPPLEVLAPALYIPVFVGAVLWLLPGGMAGAAFSSLVYGVLLVDQTRDVGSGLFVGMLVNRVATFFFYAVIIAVAAQYLEGRLRKLELYDQIDDLTELYNSAFFLDDVGLETGRSNRYGTTFAVAELVVDREAFTGFSRRRYRGAVRDLASRVRGAGRRVDRPARIDDGRRDRFLVVLPETGAEGAGVFASRISDSASAFLQSRGCAVDGRLRARAIAYPDQPEELEALRLQVAEVEETRQAIRREP